MITTSSRELYKKSRSYAAIVVCAASVMGTIAPVRAKDDGQGSTRNEEI